MVEAFIHLLYYVSPEATWVLVFLAAFIALFAFYVGVVLAAILLARDQEAKKLYFHVLRELLKLFRRRRSRRRSWKASSKKSRERK
jgi:hypothetical protein